MNLKGGANTGRLARAAVAGAAVSHHREKKEEKKEAKEEAKEAQAQEKK